MHAWDNDEVKIMMQSGISLVHENLYDKDPRKLRFRHLKIKTNIWIRLVLCKDEKSTTLSQEILTLAKAEEYYQEDFSHNIRTLRLEWNWDTLFQWLSITESINIRCFVKDKQHCEGNWRHLQFG